RRTRHTISKRRETSLGATATFIYQFASDRYWPILLKNSKKMEGYFSAENQNILNSAQHLACKLTSSSVGRDR
ncbi:MAG: hypothetical protein OEO19_20725, partial [Gammaproteobacteria bacterium]|nr:hypothetical protein [Gammaproteobacteria bacterium]